ncbi:MAG: HAMP domain-containing sensor histidine kinase [Bacteroidota bacterium]|nr:HAMP domain-containing sensor histidine kinase [Bacteroidota bacterium]
MRAKPFVLTPQWIMFDEFWISLKRRNRWLVYLRYGAAAMLAGFAAGAPLALHLRVETVPILMIAAAILAYNLVLHRLLQTIPTTHARFHGLHFALIQISLDIVALLVFLYLSGGIESPFFVLLIFHVIIGSLILPRAIVSTIITIAVAVMGTGTFMEFRGIIPHYTIGDFPHLLSSHPNYLVLSFVVMVFALYMSNYLANSISKELYQRERALTQAYKDLEDAEKAKSRYVMSVVHDLKTPIAAAITYLTLILDKTFGPLKPEIERPLERSKHRLAGAIKLINDILELSQVRLSGGLTTEKVNLTEIIHEIYDEMRIMFTSKNIRFTTWTNAAEDVYIEADPKLLKLALANLISNAHKYTDPEGNVEVHIKVKGDFVFIEVADDGIGIPEQEQSRIFEDFFRTSISKKRTTEGTGLGLTIVRQIIQQMHGSIRLESPSRLAREGRPGTAFFVTLPRILPDISPGETAKA